jgi:uncharacterized protein YndB with AHSA1/START domain
MTRPASELEDREIVITRLVDAPPAIVFRAFTEPQHVVHWWGPFGFTNTIHEMQVQPGGQWRLTMHGPDGTDYPNEIRYREVVDSERLVYSHGSGADPDPLAFDMTITFADEGGGTRVTLRQTHATEARAKEVRKFAVDGGNQTVTRLEAYLGTMREHASPAVVEGVAAGSDEDDFVIERVFDAPRDLLFEVLTDPAHLTRWFGPAGMGLRVVSSELRPGGELRYAMKPGPTEMYGKFVYREIVPPKRLAYVVSFADEHFSPIRHPMSKTWPLHVLAISTLVELDGKTVYYGRSIPIYATPEERRTFRDGHKSMVMGFKGTYDQLEEYLKTLGPARG